jgi:chromosome segregation ATPase
MSEQYEKPEVETMSVEEMLTEAQAAVDTLFDRYHKTEAQLGDLEAVLSSVREQLDEIERLLTEAERAVQRITYVAKVKETQDDAG